SRLTPYVAVPGVDNTKNFTDYGTQSAWATYAVDFNINNGFIEGFNGQFKPKSNITRAETATVVLKLLQKSNLVDVRTKL
ncbi:MAG TPA: S-layer homology domain-containing protein, partial [Ruminiclostridium sp.]|nr:S-layer homology domain-containing protein [Ruminiclostridium sp.]